MVGNVPIICVRWGVTPPKIVNSTKFENMHTYSKKHDTPTDANNVLVAGWISIDEMLPKDDYDNQFRLLCYYPIGNDVGSNYKIVWTFNFKSEIGVSHWMPLPSPPACH